MERKLSSYERKADNTSHKKQSGGLNLARKIEEWRTKPQFNEGGGPRLARRRVAGHASHARRGGADGTRTRDLLRDRETR